MENNNNGVRFDPYIYIHIAIFVKSDIFLISSLNQLYNHASTFLIGINLAIKIGTNQNLMLRLSQQGYYKQVKYQYLPKVTSFLLYKPKFKPIIKLRIDFPLLELI